MTLLSSALSRLRALLESRDRATRLLVALGLALVASGIAALFGWLLAGLPALAGPTGWRKPITFGLSGGVTTLSVAWIVSRLPASATGLRWSRVYAVTTLLEVFLIDLQAWRGVGSHFNTSTAFNGLIFSLMGILIMVAVTAMGVLGRELWRAPSVPRDVRIAGGVATLIALGGSAVGMGMASWGSYLVNAPGHHFAGIPPALKLAHAVPLHALQVLPVLLWLLSELGVSASARASAMLRASWGYALTFFGALLWAVGVAVPVVAVVAGSGVVLLLSALQLPARRTVVA